jgi:PAS domain S-box-containing protein
MRANAQLGAISSEEALRRSERRFRLSQQAAGIAALELDIATGDMIVSDNFWTLWGLEPRASINIREVQNVVLPESRKNVSTAENRRDGTTEPKIEFQIRRPDNSEVRWLARDIEFERDAAGKPVRMFGVIRDITAEKVAEERQALLTHELQHRIKNILATVSAIASQTLRTGDLPSARETFMSRLRALSEAHNILTGTHWTDASMRSVVEGALRPHGLTDRVAVSGQDQRLAPRMALSLALAVNELITNAVKYGALSQPGGKVEIGWRVVPDDLNGEPELVWTWNESGGPAVTSPSRRGFGSVLIERVLAADFGGTVTTDYAPTGLAVTLRVPVASLPSHGA